MIQIYPMQIAEQYQRERHNEADNWRLTNKKDHEQPHRLIRRLKRKRQR